MKTISISPAITLRPETYRRLMQLAALSKQDVSDKADEIITAYLDEEDELDATLEGLCPICNQDDCPGGCFEKFVLGEGIVEPLR
jgi:predicted DNA-binding protein